MCPCCESPGVDVWAEVKDNIDAERQRLAAELYAEFVGVAIESAQPGDSCRLLAQTPADSEPILGVVPGRGVVERDSSRLGAPGYPLRGLPPTRGQHGR